MAGHLECESDWGYATASESVQLNIPPKPSTTITPLESTVIQGGEVIYTCTVTDTEGGQESDLCLEWYLDGMVQDEWEECNSE